MWRQRTDPLLSQRSVANSHIFLDENASCKRLLFETRVFVYPGRAYSSILRVWNSTRVLCTVASTGLWIGDKCGHCGWRHALEFGGEKWSPEFRGCEQSHGLQVHYVMMSVSMTQVLIEAGADIDVTDLNGWTALHGAVLHERNDIARVRSERLSHRRSKSFTGLNQQRC